MSAAITDLSIDLEVLFDIALAYRPGMEAVLQPSDHPGEYLGSGVGSIEGHRVRGAVSWDLNETTGERVCQMFFAGVIQANDGATLGAAHQS